MKTDRRFVSFIYFVVCLFIGRGLFCSAEETPIPKRTYRHYNAPLIKNEIVTIKVLKVTHPGYQPIDKKIFLSSLNLAKELFHIKYNQSVVFEIIGEKKLNEVWGKIYKPCGKELEWIYAHSVRNNFWADKPESVFSGLPEFLIKRSIQSLGFEQTKLMFPKEAREQIKTHEDLLHWYSFLYFSSIRRARNLLSSKDEESLKGQSVTHWETLGMYISNLVGAQMIVVNFPLMSDSFMRMGVVGFRNLPYFSGNVVSFYPLLEKDAKLYIPIHVSLHEKVPEKTDLDNLEDEEVSVETKPKIMADALTTSFISSHFLYPFPMQLDEAKLGCVTQMSGLSYFSEARYKMLLEKGSCQEEMERVKAIVDIFRFAKEMKKQKEAENQLFSIAESHKQDAVVLYKAFLGFLEHGKNEQAYRIVELLLEKVKENPSFVEIGHFLGEYDNRGLYQESFKTYEKLVTFPFDEEAKKGIQKDIESLKEKIKQQKLNS